MSILTILEFPDERLRNLAQPVPAVDDSVRRLTEDMFETMYAGKGVGLAATQVNVPLRVIVIDISEEKNQRLCLINPEIIEHRGRQEGEEGCLSVPGFFETIPRAEQIEVRYLDVQGQSQTLVADGLLSVCIQHEIDHLDGKLFVDFLSPLKRQRIKKKLEKIHRLEKQRLL